MDMKAALKAHMAKKGAKAHPDANVKKFAKGLQGLNINVTIRKSLGSDISAACGQLAAQPARRKK